MVAKSTRKKQLASDIIMNDLLLCGGEWKPRHQIQTELLAEGHDRRLVDWYLFCLANHQPEGKKENDMNETTRKRLVLFIEKADVLAKYLAENRVASLMGIYRRVGETEWSFHPAIEGFILTFRLFVQQRDGIALYLCERGVPRRPQILDLPDVSQAWREKTEQAYLWFADFLATTPAGIAYNGNPLTRWDILETFLYGEFAHTARRDVIEEWKTTPDLFGELQLEFVGILTLMLGQILMVAQVSRQELAG